jgi:hypothetical protein
MLKKPLKLLANLAVTYYASRGGAAEEDFGRIQVVTNADAQNYCAAYLFRNIIDESRVVQAGAILDEGALSRRSSPFCFGGRGLVTLRRRS